MAVTNADIAAVFDPIAELLEIQGENPFRVRAYRNAARAVGDFPDGLAGILESGGRLPKLPGIGADLACKIEQICKTGSCALLAELHAKLPPAITALLALPGLGSKRVRILREALKVNTIEDLERAVRSGRLRTLRGFGEKTERRVLEGLAGGSRHASRFKLSIATHYATALVSHVKRVEGVIEATAAGSLRRMRETVGNLDIVVAAKRRAAAAVMDAFCGHDQIAEMRARGNPKHGDLALRPARRPARGRPGKPRRRAALLHRLEGAQHCDTAPRPGAGTQDQRVRCLSRGPPYRGRYGGIRIQRRRPALHCARGARGPRGDPCGPRRSSPPARRAQGSQGRFAFAYQGHRRP